MFVLLNPQNRKRKGRKRYPKIKGFGERYYFILDLPVIKNSPDWNGLVGNEPLLIPENLSPPPYIKRYGDISWQNKLMAEYLKKKLKEKFGDLIIYDKAGYFAPYILDFAERCRNIAVFTENEDAFSSIKDLCYVNFGADIKINSFAGLGFGISFAPFGHFGKELRENFIEINRHEILNRIKIPKEFDKISLGNVSPVSLSEALYSKWNIGKPEDYVEI